MDVVGVSPKGHISLGFPVYKHSLETFANGLSILPVKEITGRFPCSWCDNSLNSNISLVFPELDMSNKTSFFWMSPKSPCCASLGCINAAGVPV